MRNIRPAAFALLAVALFAHSTAAEPLLWKPITNSFLRVNDQGFKDWSIFQIEKKDPRYLVQLAHRFLLVDAERKAGLRAHARQNQTQRLRCSVGPCGHSVAADGHFRLAGAGCGPGLPHQGASRRRRPHARSAAHASGRTALRRWRCKVTADTRRKSTGFPRCPDRPAPRLHRRTETACNRPAPPSRARRAGPAARKSR